MGYLWERTGSNRRPSACARKLRFERKRRISRYNQRTFSPIIRNYPFRWITP